MENVSIGLALAAGFLSFVSPCVLPLVPAYIGYMGSRLTQNVARQPAPGANLQARLGMLSHGIAFVLGFTLIFVLIGLLTTALASIAGQYVGAFTEIIGRVGGLVIVLFGLQFMGLLPRLFLWLRSKSRAPLLDSAIFSLAFALAAAGLIHWALLGEPLITLALAASLVLILSLGGAFTQPGRFWARTLDGVESLLYSDTRGDLKASSRGGLLGSAFMGMVFSAGWTPCIGPLLGTILTLAAASSATSGDIAQGLLLLTAYSIGLGIPFVLTALLMDSASGLLRRLQGHMGTIERFSGALLIIIGILVASGRLQSLSQTFSQGEFADFTFRLEECGIGYLEGSVGLSHVGDCLSGQLTPLALNQSASFRIRLGPSRHQYLVHVREAETIDIELRSLGDAIPDFKLALYGPDDGLLAAGDRLGSAVDDGRLYPLVAIPLASEGLYRVVIATEADAADGRFRVKMRESQPLTQRDADLSGGAEISLAGALSTLTQLVSELGPATGLAEGNLAPDFSIETIDGRTLQLSQLRGKVALLNFWGTWCGPCRREMPEFQRAYQEWKDEGFEIVAVAYNDTVSAIKAFRDELGLSFPLALDESGAINELYAIQTRPSTYVIDREGVIMARHFGIMTEPQLRQIFRDAYPAAHNDDQQP